jgi:hypothetical protein
VLLPPPKKRLVLILLCSYQGLILFQQKV